jgi:sirohydrochlorin cobaltochelatase
MSDPKTALVVIAHGSPREESNDDVLRVLELVRRTSKYQWVQPAYLDCNAPNIDDAVEICVNAGAQYILCVPHFLHVGRHVALDIAYILSELQKKFKNVEIRLGPAIGQSPLVSEILLQRARQTLATL